MKNTLMKLCAAISMSFFITTHASAEEKISIEDAYSMCGIGAAIFKKNETVAIISNVIWDLGTTAISSATTTPEACEGREKDAAAFIYQTYPSLEEDIVKGGGLHATALLEIAGCANQQDQVVTSMQNDYQSMLANGNIDNATRLEKSVKMGASLDKAITACNS